MIFLGRRLQGLLKIPTSLVLPPNHSFHALRSTRRLVATAIFLVLNKQAYVLERMYGRSGTQFHTQSVLVELWLRLNA